MSDDVFIEYDDIIEYQISDYVFLQYSKKDNVFYLQYIDVDLEENVISIEESNLPIRVNNVEITVGDFLYFKSLTI
jgi:hypothetical protein